MPQVNSALENFDRVIKGIATENDIQDIKFFKKLLKMLTNLPNCDTEHRVKSKDVLCLQTGESSKLKPTRNLKNNLIYDNKLQNIFDYLSAAIDYYKDKIIDNGIKNLLRLCNIFLGIDLSQSELTLEQKNTLNVAYIGLFTRIANFPNLLDISNEQNTNYKMVDLLNLTNYFLENWAKSNINTQYSIFETLRNYAESIGNLTRKAGHEGRDILPIETEMKSLINLLTPYLKADQKKILMFSFAHEYKSGEELSTCKEVFDTTDCDPYNVTEEFLKISSASRSYDSKISLDENLDIGFRIIKKIRFDTSSFTEIEAETRKLNNFSHYFKKLIQEANDKGETLSENFTKYLCDFLLYQFKVFKGTDTLISCRSSFSLSLALLKSPSAKNHPLISQVLEKAFDPMTMLMNSVLENPTKNKTVGILSTLEVFADMVHVAVNDIPIISLTEKKLITNKIDELVRICFKISPCHSSSALDQFFETLGSMVRNLSKKSQGPNERNGAQSIEEITKQLIGTAKNNSISPTRISNFAYDYLDGRYDQKVKAINRYCGELFNLTDCTKPTPANQTDMQDMDITTLIPKTTTNQTITTADTTRTIPTVIPISVNETTIPVNSTTKAEITTTDLPLNINITSSNQTAVDTSTENNSEIISINSGLPIAAAATHGILSGIINGIFQYFAKKYSLHGEQSSVAKTIPIYFGMGFHAFLNAMLPTIIEYIHQGDEERAKELISTLLLEAALPIFLISFATYLVLQFVIECTKLFSERLEMPARNTVPLFGIAYNLYRQPVTTVVQLGTSIALSFFSYGLLNRISPVKNQQQFDVEAITNSKVKYDIVKDAVEMQPLNKEKILPINQANKKTYQFICLPELDEVKKLSKNNSDLLKNLIASLEKNIENLKKQQEVADTSSIFKALLNNINQNNHILKILMPPFTTAEELNSALNDDIHLDACEMYTLGRKSEFVGAMEKLGNVFKLMENNLNALQGKVQEAIGYTEAASENFSAEIITQLNSLNQTIPFLLSKVKLYKQRYSNADAIEKTEKRCKAEVNQDLFNVIVKADQSAINKRSRGKFCNNRNTFAFSSGSDGDFRISTASSSGESELSTVSGNSAHNPILPQQITPLLTSFK